MSHHQVTIRSAVQPNNRAFLIRRVVKDLRDLSLEEIQSVIAFVDSLKEQQAFEHQVASIYEEALRQSALLEGVPREEIVRQFQAGVEDIRQQAIAKGTAIEGDWRGD